MSIGFVLLRVDVTNNHLNLLLFVLAALFFNLLPSLATIGVVVDVVLIDVSKRVQSLASLSEESFAAGLEPALNL